MKRVKHIKIQFVVFLILGFIVPFFCVIHTNSQEKQQIDVNIAASRNYFIFYDDFEGSLTKWTIHTGLWQITDEYTYAGDYSLWFGNETLGHLPDSGAQGEMLSEPFDLSSREEAYLALYLSRETDSSNDLLTITINNTNSQEKIAEFIDSSSLGWSKRVYNISRWCGNSSVRVKIIADHALGTKEGWYIDDLVISPNSYFTDITDPSDTISTNDNNSYDSSWVFWFLLFFFGGFGIISVFGIFFAKKMSEKQDLMKNKKLISSSISASPPIIEEHRPSTQEKEEPQLSYIICPACGIELEGDAKFCYNCGKRL